jgi:hypothetical protein
MATAGQPPLPDAAALRCRAMPRDARYTRRARGDAYVPWRTCAHAAFAADIFAAAASHAILASACPQQIAGYFAISPSLAGC